jgi:hypothetical protein
MELIYRHESLLNSHLGINNLSVNDKTHPAWPPNRPPESRSPLSPLALQLSRPEKSPRPTDIALTTTRFSSSKLATGAVSDRLPWSAFSATTHLSSHRWSGGKTQTNYPRGGTADVPTSESSELMLRRTSTDEGFWLLGAA